MNAKQKLFATEYLKTRNATQSYVKVYGVSQNVAERCGPRLLGNAVVKKYIDERLEKVLEKNLIDADYVINGFKEIAEYGKKKVKFKKIEVMRDAKAANVALRNLGQIAGIYIEKHEHTGKDGEPLDINITIKRK